MRLTADIGANQNLPVKVLDRQLREPETKHREVISGGVRAGVPRSEDRGQRFAGLIQIAVQRIEPVAVLVVAGGELLLRMRGQQHRVDVQRDPLRTRVRVPHPRSSLRPRGAYPTKQMLVDRLQDPVVVVSDARAPNSRSWPR